MLTFNPVRIIEAQNMTFGRCMSTLYYTQSVQRTNLLLSSARAWAHPCMHTHIQDNIHTYMHVHVKITSRAI